MSEHSSSEHSSSEHSSSEHSPDASYPDALQLFEQQRGRLVGLAYRMLGSVADAEDVLQDIHLQWLQQDIAQIGNPIGWLVTAVTRRCIDWQRSARHRREQYVGTWLPEPLIEPYDAAMASMAVSGPQEVAELASNLTLAFLHLLEQLNAQERAVFILREAFDWSYADIAQALDRTDVHCRQLFQRARQKVGGDLDAVQMPQNNVHGQANGNGAQNLLGQFLQTCMSGDFDGLLQLLHPDLVAYSDGGGKVTALLHPINGRERVARFLLRITQPRANSHVVPMLINREPGLVVYENGQPTAATIFVFRQQRLWRMFSLRNPDKLRVLTQKHIAR